jgi:hypothetical protein
MYQEKIQEHIVVGRTLYFVVAFFALVTMGSQYCLFTPSANWITEQEMSQMVGTQMHRHQADSLEFSLEDAYVYSSQENESKQEKTTEVGIWAESQQSWAKVEHLLEGRVFPPQPLEGLGVRAVSLHDVDNDGRQWWQIYMVVHGTRISVSTHLPDRRRDGLALTERIARQILSHMPLIHFPELVVPLVDMALCLSIGVTQLSRGVQWRQARKINEPTVVPVIHPPFLSAAGWGCLGVVHLLYVLVQGKVYSDDLYDLLLMALSFLGIILLIMAWMRACEQVPPAHEQELARPLLC